MVQDALLTIFSSPVKLSSFTPKTMVFKSPLAGAEMMTLPAPASKWAAAFSASANTPVDSTTKSMFWLPHGRSAGLRSAVISITLPFTTKLPSETETSPGNAPWMLSYLSRWANVLTSVKSLMETTSNSERETNWRNAKRPMRPNPLIAMRFMAKVV